jgi:hypothetical protein
MVACTNVTTLIDEIWKQGSNIEIAFISRNVNQNCFKAAEMANTQREINEDIRSLL